MNTEKKTPFYSQRLDEKYSLLNRSIGIDTQTQSLSTRTIESSNVITSDTLNGQQLTFNFTVSPSAYIDWNNSRMEIGFKFTNYQKTAVVEHANNKPTSSIPWNLLLYIFEEIKVKFNGTVILNKVSSEYLETQTFKLLTEYTNDDLNASEVVFAPVGDYNYNVGLAGGYSFDNTDISSNDPNAKLRVLNWISPMASSHAIIHYKRPTFKELFFDMPGFSKNLRNVTIEVKLKDKITLPKIVNKAAVDREDLMIIKSMKLQLHEYNFSPSAAISALNNKINGEDEHLSFIDVNKQDKVYGPYLIVTNQENIQWVAVTQFCHYVSSKVGANNGAQYQNCGQFLLLNGYGNANADAAVGNLLHRSDLPPTTNTNPPEARAGTACANPISSIQAQYGNILYPSNAIETQVKGSSTLLKTDELYSEYKKAVGFKNPAVPEDIFKRTMPFFMVKFTPNIKLIQTGDITIRMPGFGGTQNTGNKNVSIIYGQLKSYNISPSGIVSETIPSY